MGPTEVDEVVNDEGLPVVDTQVGEPYPPANPDGGPGQFSFIPGCKIDHVAEGSPGCEQCQQGFFKLDNDKVNNGDEICYPCDGIPGCSFCNDYFGCDTCEAGLNRVKGIILYNDGTPYYDAFVCE